MRRRTFLRGMGAVLAWAAVGLQLPESLPATQVAPTPKPGPLVAEDGVNYWIRTRYQDANGVWGEWSQAWQWTDDRGGTWHAWDGTVVRP